MNNSEKQVAYEILFEHTKLFHAYRNILYLSNNKCYMNNDFNNELTLFIERNNKNIENIIYFSLILKTRLRQKLLNDTFKVVNEIDNEIKKDSLSIELKTKLEEEKKEILDIFLNEVNETKKIIDEHCLFLSSEINQLKTQFVSDRIIPFIIDKENFIDTLTTHISTLEHETEKTKQELNIIRQSEDILNKQSFFDLFNGSIPLKAEIEALNIENNEKNILSSLIEILNRLFSTLSHGFSYTKIVETRHQLTTLFLSKIKQLSQLKNEKQNALFTLKHYYKLIDIDPFLRVFIEQLGLLNESWQEINSQFTNLKNNMLLTEKILPPLFLFLDDFTLYYGNKEQIKYTEN
ncbi:alpha-xenorhabdolysin family binary toxin subunit B [Proteus vulgaris]|uniref:alpha-xenorhabdolysin family binary toxin subunit B n=1 Tax=Proteus vulgaris TaxID=585 RepID=UPI0018E4AD82|nr:alpha-xenorhabdolysin family binary toxin subunit B [Proteus vulgaris]MBI6529554.1 alpha-xenorhabdolysin family binary toxin subunit B [Proteus vulgaris]